MATAALVHRDNPSALVEAAYARILHERMRGLPILNPQLSVRAVGFESCQNEWRGIVLTPWCMSLLLLPGEGCLEWTVPRGNQRRYRSFPAGTFSFLASDEKEIGSYLSCALISPMAGFACQEDAVLTAEAALVGLSQTAAEALPPPEKRAIHGRRRFLGIRH
jgi:[NiFe] hydrogenase assembly HybE family chaperone